MKRLTLKLLALCMVLAILSGMAAISEPVILEDTIDDEPVILEGSIDGEPVIPEGDVEIGFPGFETFELAQDDIAPVDVAPETGGSIAPNDIVKSGTCGPNINWTLDDSGLLTLSGSGDMDSDFAFWEAIPLGVGIKRAVVNEGITSLTVNTFNGCEWMESVSLPDSLRNIYAGAFTDCRSLTRVDIPYGVPWISGYCFEGCINLARVTVPESVTEVVDHAFDNCPSLTLYGYDGSYIQTYANQSGTPFVSLGAAPKRPPLPEPTPVPTVAPTAVPTAVPTAIPTAVPTAIPTVAPTAIPTVAPTAIPTMAPTAIPTAAPTATPIPTPTEAPRISLSGCKIKVKRQVYSGKAKKPAVKVNLDGQKLSKGIDYTVDYRDNTAIGTATVTVTGVGRYTGVAEATFRIDPKAVTGLKLAPGKGRITVSWKKAPGDVTGYQLQYAPKKSFSGAKQVTVKKAATVKKVLKGLKKGQTCYVRIRAYKKVGRTTYYSAWSPAKKGKVK